MMRWLADENIPRSAIAFLRSRGEDTAAIAELSPGIPDEAVIQVARMQGRILVSFDRDHGDLIFGHAVAPPRGGVSAARTAQSGNTSSLAGQFDRHGRGFAERPFHCGNRNGNPAAPAACRAMSRSWVSDSATIAVLLWVAAAAQVADTRATRVQCSVGLI